MPPAEPQGFGEAFLDEIGIDAVHVIGRGNDWYQYEEMPSALAAIRAAVGASVGGTGRRVLTYGSSMGGYAAIRFAGAVGAAEAVAISPQYALDPQVVPFETRWPADAGRIRFLPWPDEAAPPPATVFYDPRDPDRLHVERWAATRPVTRVPIPYAGHPAGVYLAETGLLGPAVRDILAGCFDAAALVREARARRRRSGKYLMNLATGQPISRRRLAVRLARRAVEAVPASVDYTSRLAVLLYRSGEYAEAERMHVRALALAPGDYMYLFRYSRFLQRMGRFDAALDLARRAEHAHPASLPLREHARTLARQAGPPTPMRLWLRIHNAGLHRYSQIAWRRGWPLIGRLVRP